MIIDKFRRQYLLIALMGFLFFTTLYVGLPWLRKPLVREHNLLEMVQALLYLGTVVVVLRNLTVIRRTQPTWLFSILIVLGVFGFLEEVSYGETLFLRFTPFFSDPPKFFGVKIDAIHDFIQVLYVGLTTEMSWFGIGVLGVAIGLSSLCFLIWGRLYDLRTLAKFFYKYQPLEFVFICGFLLFFATLLDLEFFHHHFLVFLEEFLEALAALSLFFAALVMSQQSQSVFSR